MKNKRGTSLLESILALFLLTMATLLVVNLFHTALQRSRLGEQEHIARLIAESNMAELRAWSAEGGYPDQASLATQDGRAFKDPNHSAYKVTLSLKPATLQSFCSEFETAHPGDEILMPESCATAEVTVTWSSGMGQRTHRLASLVRESPKVLEKVTISGLPSTLSANSSVTLTAKALDDTGKEIKDVVMVWWVEASSGIGTIEARRRGNTAVFTNRAEFRNGTTGIVSGDCRIAVLATCDGREVIGYSSSVNLSP